jgi:vacuolar-type H+-ATPase subunit H
MKMGMNMAKEHGANLINEAKNTAQTKGLEFANQAKQQLQEQGTNLLTQGKQQVQAKGADLIAQGQQQGANSLQAQGTNLGSSANETAPTEQDDKHTSIGTSIENATQSAINNETKDEDRSEQIKSFISAFGNIVDDDTLDEHTKLAEFTKGEIKKYESTLLRAISESLPIDKPAQTLFFKKISETMNKQNIRGGKAKSKKKHSRKPKRKTKRRK